MEHKNTIPELLAEWLRDTSLNTIFFIGALLFGALLSFPPLWSYICTDLDGFTEVGAPPTFPKLSLATMTFSFILFGYGQGFIAARALKPRKMLTFVQGYILAWIIWAYLIGALAWDCRNYSQLVFQCSSLFYLYALIWPALAWLGDIAAFGLHARRSTKLIMNYRSPIG